MKKTKNDNKVLLEKEKQLVIAGDKNPVDVEAENKKADSEEAEEK